MRLSPRPATIAKATVVAGVAAAGAVTVGLVAVGVAGVAALAAGRIVTRKLKPHLPRFGMLHVGELKVDHLTLPSPAGD